ncbi:MAG: hypothetical protein RLZZ299_2020 [Pseudomonadota bacterium]|jgi:hypothetical protein
MDTQELLASLRERLDALDTHRQFIARAREQMESGKFAASVIERVIADHERKAFSVADDVAPMVPRVQAAVARLREDKTAAETARAELEDRIQEFELRHQIGELDSAQLEAEVTGLRSEQGERSATADALGAEIETLDAVLARWTETAAAMGRPKPAAPPAPAPALAKPQAAPAAPPPAAADTVSGSRPVAPPVPPPAAVSPADEIAVDVAIEDAPAVDVVVDAPSVDAARADEAPRRAMLVYAEGTPEEHMYPFEGDELKIGRARGPDPKTGMTNDIVLSHDSLVSRYCHARVHRRGNFYYVENRSVTNGTLLDNELVTERRLLGGEEILLGKSSFKFRFID